MMKITACCYGFAILVVGLVGCAQEQTADLSSQRIVVASDVERLTITSDGDWSVSDSLIRLAYVDSNGQSTELTVDYGSWQQDGAKTALFDRVDEFFSAMSPEFFHRLGHALLLRTDRLGQAATEIFESLPSDLGHPIGIIRLSD